MKGYIDKDALKRALPLAYAAQELGIVFNEQGLASCPFHQDENPSFHLFMGNDGFERWACQPCGLVDDVFGLIQRLEGRGFVDSLDRAEELLEGMPAGWQPAIQLGDDVPTETLEQWWDQIQEARTRAAHEEYDGTLCIAAGFIDEHEDDALRRQVDRYLRDTWGWGVDHIGRITMPHWQADGSLTGIKIRSGKSKFSKKGSKYDELYGSWQPPRYPRMLLCEGESDAVWAAMQGHPIDVRAVPSGAGTVKPQYIDQAKQWEVVYLALDPDKAGLNATMEWASSLGFDMTRVCILPQGKDLRDSKPNLKRLLDDAVMPLPDPQGLNINFGRFERVTAQGNPRICTTWSAIPMARLVPGDHDEDELENAWELEVTVGAQKRIEVMRVSDVHSSSKLKTWASARGLDCMASDSDTTLIGAFITARASILPEVFQTARLGLHEPPERYAYAGRTLVLPDEHDGELPWKFVSKINRADAVLLPKREDAQPIKWDWLIQLLHMHDPLAMQVILSWFAASIRRIELRDFPLLFIGGPSGSGKSTIAQLLCRMFGSRLGQHLASATPFPILSALGSSTTLPVFFDEWSRQSGGAGRETLQGAIPFIYEGSAVPRGQRDLSVREIRCTAPVVVAGEDTFSLDREMDRMVGVGLTRAGQNLPQLQYLSVMPLESFGFWYNDWALHARELPPLPRGKYSTRPEYNAEVLRCGWETLRWFMRDSAMRDPNVPQLPDIDLSALDQMREHRVNEYELLLQAAVGMTADNKELVWDDPNGQGTWVRMMSICSPAVLGKLDVRPPGGHQAMRKYFESLGHQVEGKRVIPPFAPNEWVYASLIHGYHMRDPS